MKTSIIAIITLVFSMALNAQITHEHTYNFSGTLAEIDSGEFRYYVMDVPMKQCRIYNEDHTLFKTINLTVPQGYFLYDVKFVSRKTFNSDEDIELLYIYSKANYVNAEYVSTTYGLKVVNENGVELLNVQNGGFAEIKELDGAPKLLVYQYIYSESYYLVYTNVYAIGGGTSKSAAMEAPQSIHIYPNPAGDLVRVEISPEDLRSGGQVVISDLSGKKLREQSYGPGTTEIPVATGQLRQGTYILNVISADGTSAAAKIIKN
jgi:hypothetical protein